MIKNSFSFGATYMNGDQFYVRNRVNKIYSAGITYQQESIKPEMIISLSSFNVKC
jgi:hypothetical protein